MQPPHTEESEFWKSLPDDILNSMYKEMLDGSFSADQVMLPPEHQSTQLPAPVPPPRQMLELSIPQRGLLEGIERFAHENDAPITAVLQAASTLDASARGRTSSLVDAIELHLKSLRGLLTESVLDHQTLHRVRQSTTALLLLRTKCAILLAPSGAAPVALFLADQPLPQVVFKGKSMDPYTVQVISSQGWKEQSSSKMQAVLCTDDLPVGTVVPPAPLENDTSRVDPFQRVSLFNELKVAVSTRMTPVALRFKLQVLSPTGRAVGAESERSRSLIVITNESQWSDAAGKLLLADAFEGEGEVPWGYFANTLHSHFLAATRQDPSRPSRALGEHDWYYLRSKFDNSPIVRHDRATAFWQLFGPTLASLRFKRHINSLWFAGLIFGFISKDSCNAMLAMQELGTFLIRFSESSPGLFTIAYVSDDPYERVKHYLVKQEDLSLNKTLPDLLREKPQFHHALQLDIATGAMRRYPRDAVFAVYYSKNRKAPATGSTGYVSL